jgi:23S rRNA (uracil1939-C5)-methyltransferase
MRKHNRHGASRSKLLREDATPLILEVVIERIVPGGYGLAHSDGLTLFVSLAAPGDHAIVRVDKKKGAVAFASIVELLEPSPLRITPRCKYFGRCGGCDFQHLDYKAQLEAKREIILDCLRRIARIEPPNEIQIFPSLREWNYRSRAQWRYDAASDALGYFERGSHTVCDVVECPILTPQMQNTLTQLRQKKQSNELMIDIEEFQAVAGDEGVSLMPEATRTVSRMINGFRYSFSAEGFFQINQDLLPALVDYAIEDAKGENALDLYCGVGLFTLPLSKRFKCVTGVETSPDAVSFARLNAAQANLEHTIFRCTRVDRWLKENSEEIGKVDFVLLDPPRTGAEAETIESLLQLLPGKIVYVSCDPATLARDLKMLRDSGGYSLERIAGFDLFPQTHHVETVVHLKPAQHL